LQTDTVSGKDASAALTGDIAALLAADAEPDAILTGIHNVRVRDTADNINDQQIANVALPTATQGYVNTGTAVWTGRRDQITGYKVWRKTIRGYFPNGATDVQNVNGVATSNLWAIGSGIIIDWGGSIDRVGASQTHLLSGLPNNASHLAPLYTSGGITSSAKQVRLWNTMTPAADFNAAQFVAWVEYTDSNNP